MSKHYLKKYLWICCCSLSP